ncbi:MAG: hypothetical protein CMI36_06905 [Owenweeksia sp.]|nr:hypothetical protein [Owenweeksia sp.]MBF98701.1 hypothetical protein [Owenweeksia sp.]HCQ15005.1 hypothetical protein [Cryomorphaceae bacterium]|tara:strand:- start:562 stop:1953 length:1392 start_codon:yes stop_codon:yes gene_type:complete
MKKPTTPLSACLFLLFCIFQWSATQAQGENSLSFDGVDDYVTCPNASAQIASSTGMSLSCWVYATNPSPSYPNFDGFAGFRNEINCDFYILHLSTNTLEGRIRNSAGNNFDVSATGFQINTWQHVVLTYNGSALKIYLNGSLSDNVAASGSITNTTETLNLGRIPFSSADFMLGGQLDEVGLWDKALSAAEVNCLYNYGLESSDPNLKLFYQCNQGTSGGTNSGITTLMDTKGNINGALNGFALSGTSSNFVSGVSLHGSTTASICAGDSLFFEGQYYKQAGVYQQVIPLGGGCDSLVQLTLEVDSIDVGISKFNAITLQSASATGTYTWIDCITGTAVPGATQQKFIPKNTGSYAVVVTKGNCSDTSACLYIGFADVEESALESARIYPNPSKGSFTFSQGSDIGKGVLHISSLTGALLASKPIDGVPETNIEVNLPAGIYQLTFQRSDAESQKTWLLTIEP